ncbi:FAD-binding oxidoreductase [Agromyces aerolatus]|uniref:FAD-binding oxidoreductase n=1 Tax=Agromyces sp. LY-1074 TaxID=3074080 RepID=UPI00285E3E59|nr:MULTISPECIES: FAD-linked oxidase C-terminal domain-containing protein [unclassified Agromyces]MDR5701079.1 FAD-linked oxidase C-terminal domain-containing protein [Agromyces sp. LY-1074]MDR5707719.1 FAD-linked oxidase C-terminal domain-containing protein [Agromyces sp. LY-1358]
MPNDVLTHLRRALGASVTTDPAVLRAVREDRSGLISPATAIAVVRAGSVDEVQATLRIASQTGTPVVPRGAGTGLAGGAVASEGAIVLDVSRMNRIVEIDEADELAVVEPGVLNGDLNETVRPLGLWFAPDPASRAISSVGGNIATNAGGLLCAKYGVTREAVLGLAVVLADGRLLRTGHRTVKGVTGYDLTALLTGSEGTLGVIVEATVRLRPIPPGEPVTLAAAFSDVEAAAVACAGIAAARIRPALLELIDPAGVARVAEYLGADALAGTPLETLEPGETFLLAQADGAGAADDADRIAAVFAESGGRVTRSTDVPTGERLLAIRRSMHTALASRGQVLIEDVAVPRSRLPEMFRAIEQIGVRHGLEIPTLAHAGDGNLHPNFVFEGDEVPAQVWAAADELFRVAVALGGTLTGEHGVGLLKRRWLRDELGDDQWQLQRELKRVFDPAGILNPAVMFEPEAPSAAEAVAASGRASEAEGRGPSR